MNRAKRRRISKEIGKVGIWEPIPYEKFRENKDKSGWFAEMNRGFVNGKYVVMIRDVNTPWGKIQHATIRNAASTDIPWREKQRIKNDIFGAEAVAIEVFPKESELVDEAMMYHLWLLPLDFKLPFTIAEGWDK